VGYVQPAKDNIEPAVDELQTYLLDSLPAYMVPSRFVRLDAPPVSPNGKLDFALLPPAEELEPLGRKDATPITSPIEEKLLIMVRQLLENDEVTADEDFFLAGGHSLLAMQLLTRLQKAFGVKLSLHQLFESPTVSELAVLVEQKLLDGIDAMTDEEAERSTARHQRYRCCR
jgi:acyl carrier protein